MSISVNFQYPMNRSTDINIISENEYKYKYSSICPDEFDYKC